MIYNTGIPVNGNYQEFNVDWLICRIKEALQEWDKTEEWLKNYIENINIEDDVNNWLDNAIINGTLGNIISGYVKGNPIVVNSTEDMTDNERLYVLNSDGFLYYFKDGSFVSSDIKYSSLLNYFTYNNTITKSNFSENLPDLNNVENTCCYILNFPYGETELPNNLPFTTFNTQAVLFICFGGVGFSEEYPRQMLIDNDSIYTRYKGAEWNEWVKLNGRETYKAYGYITDDNYSELLPDANVILSGTYILNFSYGSENITKNLPYKNFYGRMDVLITIPTYNIGDMYTRQFLIGGYNTLYSRFYNGVWSDWKKYTNEEFYVVDINGNGDYTSLVKCFKEHVDGSSKITIYVKKGTYDLIQEFSEIYPDFGTTKYEGLLLNNCDLIMDEGVVLSAVYSGENNIIKEHFSAIKCESISGKIIGGKIIKNNVRYCIHDDVYNTSPYSKTLIKNMHLIVKDSERDVAIGGGLGTNSYIEVCNCLIENAAEGGYGIFYHNSADQGKSKIMLHDNVLTKGDITIESYGPSEKDTSYAIVSNNKCGKINDIKYDGADNITLYSYNNITES